MRMRWWVVSLLFASTTLNYMDRTVLAVLLPVIRDQMQFGPEAYGQITAAFSLAYTVSAVIGGKLLDRYGTRLAFGVAAGIWSLAAALHATVVTPMQFGIWRAMLGAGESVNLPACTKAASEWFPPKERAFAVGVFMAGLNVAAIAGPPLFIAMQAAFGWRACFAITGLIGFVWVAAWFLTYRRPQGAPLTERVKRATLADVLRCRQTWGYSIGKFLTDPVWWFYLFWLPLYFHDVRKFEMKELAWALPFIYFMSGVGAAVGGWFSGFLMRRGWTTGNARKTSMLFCALAMPVAALGVLVKDAMAAVLLFSLATAAHQAWMTNLFTATSDVFPQDAVGSVNGVGGSLGSFGGVFISSLIPGYVIGRIGYTPLFLMMSCLYLVAMLAVHVLMGDLRPITLRRSAVQEASE
jgi:ACS family hexuronate transporter-like MFS transporter